MINLRAYAKINLGLRVLGKREDGYHDIETILHRIDIYDSISFAKSENISLVSDSRELTSGEENLCLRAARLLSTHSGAKGGAAITLRKNIPIGAGLGGGSSDAATTLIGLTELWALDIKREELHRLAAQLGSDVPYFLQKGTACATGRGDTLEYFSLNLPYWIVVIYPHIHVSTAWAYQQVKVDKTERSENLRNNLVDNLTDGKNLRELIRNDFETIVFRAHPELTEMKRKYYEHGALFAQMSGSGSSVYGLFASEKEARSVCEKMSGHGKSFLTRPGFSL